MSYKLPKILIGVPTYDAKNYCLDAFVHNLKNLDYPKNKIEIYFADNSKDNKNALMINKKYGIKCFWKDYGNCTLFEKLANTHNQLRRYFLDSDCDYMLHLESDIFPPKNVLQELLWCRKPIVNALYQVFDASWRQLCIKLNDQHNPHHKEFVFHTGVENFHHWWIEGKLQKCFIAGIGCCLMKKKVMEKFAFRHDETLMENFPPDTYFAEDLRLAGVQNWVHTGLLCFHWNREDWGRHFQLIEYEKSE